MYCIVVQSVYRNCVVLTLKPNPISNISCVRVQVIIANWYFIFYISLKKKSVQVIRCLIAVHDIFLHAQSEQWVIICTCEWIVKMIRVQMHRIHRRNRHHCRRCGIYAIRSNAPTVHRLSWVWPTMERRLSMKSSQRNQVSDRNLCSNDNATGNLISDENFVF